MKNIWGNVRQNTAMWWRLAKWHAQAWGSRAPFSKMAPQVQYAVSPRLQRPAP